MVRRRDFITLIGGAAVAWPRMAWAQRSTPPVIGFLGFGTASASANRVEALRAGLRELGYVEGKNLVIEWRFADNKVERLPRMASELVRLKVDVIVAQGAPAISAAQKATTTIPIVIGSTADPVGSGFVKSLAHPGGNTTGLSTASGDVSSKYLEMLLSMVPKVSRVAVLMNPDSASQFPILKIVQATAQKTNLRILSVEARTPAEIDNAFSVMIRENAQALIVLRDALFNQQVHQIAELATKSRLPSITAVREYVEAGGLMSYGTSLSDAIRRAATYVDKILKGAKPGDLPVEQPTKFELFINRRTAKALGLTIPQSLLISADKVIE